MVYDRLSTYDSEMEAMIPPYIIEQIRRRQERIDRENSDRPAVQLPLVDPFEVPREYWPDPNQGTPEEEHGVVIIQLSPSIDDRFN